MLNNALPIIVEMPVELWLNGQKNTTFMCSPYDLEELAIGHLMTRGIIKDISPIVNIEVNMKSFQIFVTTNMDIHNQIYSVPSIIVSGTSSVSEFSEEISNLPIIDSEFSIDIKTIQEIANILNSESLIYKETGGVHGSIIWSESNYYLKEDIGRHCSVDKAIGAALKDGVDLKNSFICTTGRISLDMLLKSAVVGLPIVTSFKYPSDMGVKLADHCGVTIVSRALLEEPLIYGKKNRII